MSLRPLLLLAFALGGCVSLPSPDLAACEGAARRPANPHGSVLAPLSSPTASPAVDAEARPSGGRL